MARRRPEPPLDPFERAARRVDPELAQLAEAAEPPRHLRAPRLLLMLGVLVVAVTVVKGGGGKAPGLARNCTTPGFALSSTSVSVGSSVAYTAVGPEKDSVVLALDSPAAPGARTVSGPTHLDGCLLRGRIALDAPAGDHTVTAFLVGGDGTTTPVATRRITVR